MILAETKTASQLEEDLFYLIGALNLTLPIREYRFCERRWRFDFAWPDRKLAVEVEGGLYSGGRHVRGKGYQADMQKYNRAVVLGWRLLRFSGEMIQSGEAIKEIRECLGDSSNG